MTRVRARDLRDFLGRALRDDLSAARAALGSEIDDPVRRLDHVEIVLDDEYGVPLLHETVEHLEEQPHVLEVEARRRLIENVEGAPRVALRELGRELDALRLAARERGRALAEVHVAEADVEQRLELLADARLILEEGARILDGHVEHVGDARAAEANLERLAVVALPLAHLARHVDVGKKVHLDLHEPVALTRLAAAALHVERESARTVAADLRIRQLGEELADGREESRVRRGIGARRATDRALVDVDHLVDVLEAGDAIVLAGDHARPVKVAREMVVENVLDQRRLSGAGNAGDRDEEPQRYLSSEILQVVRASPFDPQREALSRLPARIGYRDLHLTTEIFPGK